MNLLDKEMSSCSGKECIREERRVLRQSMATLDSWSPKIPSCLTPVMLDDLTLSPKLWGIQEERGAHDAESWTWV